MSRYFQEYLEYMTPNEKRIAYKQGQSNLKPTESKVKDVKYPDWFEANLIQNSYGQLTLKDFIWILKTEIFNNTNVKPGTRIVVSKDGSVYWCESMKWIHSIIVLYMMALGHIPMIEKYSNYQWALDNNFEDFVCLEYTRGQTWRFAESYKSNRKKDFEPHYNKYKKVFNKIGVKLDELF